MKYTEQIKAYASPMPQELQKECQIQIMKLRREGFSFEWIFRAITHKEWSEWVKFGFGLLHTKSYQNQITNLLEAEKNQLRDIDLESLSWDSILSDEENDSQPDQAGNHELDSLFTRYGVANV